MNSHITQYFDDFDNFDHFGITVNDMSGIYLYMNNAFCDIVGYKRRELLGQGFQLITHPDDNQKNEELDQLLRDGIIPFFQLKKRYLHKKGHVVNVLLQVAMIKKPQQLYIAMVMEVNEETSHPAQQDSFNQAINSLPEQFRHLLTAYEYISRYKLKNQRKSNHLANVVHELRTPLNSINGFAQMLKRHIQKENYDKCAAAADYITQGCKTLNQTIGEILDFEMLERGSFKLQIDNINLLDIVTSVITMLQNLLQNNTN